MALSTIPFSGLGADASKQGINFRNLIINGDMSIAQRGTSITGLTNESNYGSVDRYKPIINGSGTWTSSQETDVPTGQGFAKSMKMACTTLDATPNYLFVSQKLEGQMLQHLKKGTSNAESLTCSFWVKSNKTGTYIVELYDADNARRISKSYSISSASTWEKKTLTFEGDTTGSFDNDNAQSLQVNFWLGAGTSFTSGTLGTSWSANTNADRAVGQVNLADSTSNYINFTGVQLEVGTSASDFEFLPYDVNLQRCQRYYFEINPNGANGGPVYPARTNGGFDVQNIGIDCPVPLRIGNPSITIQSGTIMQVWANTFSQTSAGGGSVTGLVDTGSNSNRLMVNTNGFSGLTGNISAVWGPILQSMPVDAEL